MFPFTVARFPACSQVSLRFPALRRQTSRAKAKATNAEAGNPSGRADTPTCGHADMCFCCSMLGDLVAAFAVCLKLLARFFRNFGFNDFEFSEFSV